MSVDMFIVIHNSRRHFATFSMHTPHNRRARSLKAHVADVSSCFFKSTRRTHGATPMCGSDDQGQSSPDSARVLILEERRPRAIWPTIQGPRTEKKLHQFTCGPGRTAGDDCWAGQDSHDHQKQAHFHSGGDGFSRRLRVELIQIPGGEQSNKSGGNELRINGSAA